MGLITTAARRDAALSGVYGVAVLFSVMASLGAMGRRVPELKS